VGTASSYTFLGAHASHTIDATFAAAPAYTIAASAGSGGSISPSGNVAVTCGTDRKLDITPDGCHTIKDVKVDGISVGTPSSYTFLSVHASHTIDATFEDAVPPTIQVISPNGGENVLVGSSIKLEWTASDNCCPIPAVDLLISRDNGATYTPIQLA